MVNNKPSVEAMIDETGNSTDDDDEVAVLVVFLGNVLDVPNAVVPYDNTGEREDSDE